MRKIVPLCIMFIFGLVSAHGRTPVVGVGENTAPIAELRDPIPGTTFTPGTELHFTGYGSDLENGTSLTHTWRMDYHDGATVSPGPEVAYQEWIGDGESAGYFNIPPDLVPTAGTFYRLYFTVTDYDGLTDTDSVDIAWSGQLSNKAPDAVLRNPRPGTTFTPGTEFSFTGYGNDPDNGTSLTHTWRMDYHDGATVSPGPEVAYQEWIGDGESAGYFYIPADLVPSAGAFYRLYFTVEDYYGLTDTDSIDIPWSGQLNTTPPEIEEHPQDITVNANSPVTFSVNARFATSYQWTFEGSNIPGATNSTYQIASAQPQHAGTYRVLVSNAAGTSMSNEAELTVIGGTNALVFKTNPANLLVLQSGAPRSTPYTFTGAPGTQVNIGSSTQTMNGVEYTFSNWAHGGPPIQNFTVPTGTKYYTVNYSRSLGFGPWRTTEVGGLNLHGTASYNAGTFTLTASGNDIWSIIDAFRFVYQSYTGDVDIRAKVTSLTNTHPWAKAGVMIRNSADPKAMNVMMLISASNGASFQNRAKAGEITSAQVVPASAPSWVRIVRSGNTFTGYVSSDGANWTPVGTPLNLPMNAKVLIGLAATSHNTAALTTATFTDVSVSTPAALLARSEETQFSVYPNPANGNTLQVKSSPIHGSRKLEIVNVYGKVVYEQTLSDESDATVDIQTIPHGVYIVRLSNKERVETRSLIRK